MARDLVPEPVNRHRVKGSVELAAQEGTRPGPLAAISGSDILAERIEGVNDDMLRSALPHRRGFANVDFGARPFIACFCEKEDLLSQWRGYGTGTAAFSLGVETSDFLLGDLPRGTVLRRVVYDIATQQAMVGEVVDAWLATIKVLLETGFRAAEILPYPAIWVIQSALAEHHVCFKNPGFEEEHEWRLIRLVNARDELALRAIRRTQAVLQDHGITRHDETLEGSTRHLEAEGLTIEFRQSALGLVPYISLSLKSSGGRFRDQIPISQVIQGPTPHAKLSLESLMLFLDSQGFNWPHTEVKESAIPLR